MESVYTHKGQRSGDSGAESYQRDVEACKNIFVPWAWLVGILVGLFGIYGATLYFSVRHEDSQDARIEMYHNIAVCILSIITLFVAVAKPVTAAFGVSP